MLNAVIGLMGGGFDPDAIAYFNQLTVQPSGAYKSAINTLVKQLKLDGNWQLLDRLWIHATEIQQHARVSLVNPSSTKITEVNSPTFTANQGYTGNGTNMYLNTNYSFLNSSVQFTQNLASIGIYSRTNLLTANKIDFGATTDISGGKDTFINPYSSGGSYFYNVNGGVLLSGSANSNTLGMHSALRSASNLLIGYRNGIQQHSSAVSSQTMTSLNAFVLARNDLGSAAFFSNRQISLTFIGGNVNQSTFYNAIQTFATTRGFNV